MFTNIGEKIKMTAKICCWCSIFICAITGLTAIVTGSFLIGLIVLIAGPLSAWVGSFLLYGFGELIDNSCAQTNLLIKMDMEKNQ